MSDTEVLEQKADSGSDLDVDGGKFLTFFLGEEEYAIEILKVQEIIGLMKICGCPITYEEC